MSDLEPGLTIHKCVMDFNIHLSEISLKVYITRFQIYIEEKAFNNKSVVCNKKNFGFLSYNKTERNCKRI